MKMTPYRLCRTVLAAVLLTATSSPGALLVAQAGDAASAAPRAHRVLAADRGKIHIFDETGKSTWSFDIQSLHDLHYLDNGNILAQRNLREVVEISPAKEIVWRYDSVAQNGKAGDRVEVHAFQRLADGITMIAESGRARILEVNQAGEIVHQIPLTVNNPHPHRDTRLVRWIEGGHYLVCHEGDGAVREYDRDGKVVWDYAIPLFGKERKGGHGPEAFGNHVFGAIRLPNGNTVIATGNGHSILEVNPAKEVVWKIEQNDLPGITLAWVTTLELLPDGNLVIGNCHAGDKNPQIIEVNRKKEVVWQFHNWTELGNSTPNSQLLGVKGTVIR